MHECVLNECWLQIEADWSNAHQHPENLPPTFFVHVQHPENLAGIVYILYTCEENLLCIDQTATAACSYERDKCENGIQYSIDVSHDQKKWPASVGTGRLHSARIAAQRVCTVLILVCIHAVVKRPSRQENQDDCENASEN